MKKIYEWTKKIYGVDELQGYTDEDIDYMRQLFGTLPQVVEEFYRVAARTSAIQGNQDFWAVPEYYKNWKWLMETGYLILLVECQNVCRAGIRKEDLNLDNPPVYVTEDNKNWVLSSNTASDFIAAALGYEATFSFEYCPEEFYWINKEEFEILQEKLIKLPYEMNWVGDMNLSLYCNTDDNLVAVMDCGGDRQMLYGAASKESYDKLLAVIGNLGEAM